MRIFSIIFMLIATSNALDITDVRDIDYTNHPCDRDCSIKSESLTCEYKFVVEWYYTMSKACYDCPKNKTDCFRKHCIVMDGNPRMVVSINRELPGPAIRVCEGDIVKVHVANHLDNGEGLAMHWHGMYMQQTPWMDGATMLTQCPIAAGTIFTYKFEATPPGNHWYHSHTGYQRADGLVGSLVVKQNKRYDVHGMLYDHDLKQHVIMMMDWERTSFQVKELNFLHYGTPFSVDNAVFLDVNNYVTSTNPTTNVTTITQRPIYTVSQNNKYRFRVAHVGSLACGLELTIDNHEMTIISIDGADVKPYKATNFMLMSGERVDFVLNANQKVGNYWVRMKAENCHNHHQNGILRYDGADAVDPTSSEFTESDSNYRLLGAWGRTGTAKRPWLSELETSNSAQYPSLKARYRKAKDTRFIKVDFYTSNNPLFNDPKYYPNKDVKMNQRMVTPMLNNVAYQAPPVPILTQPFDTNGVKECDPASPDFDKTKYCKDGFCKCTHIIDVKLNRAVDLVLYIEGALVPMPHPMHLHGYHFYVMAMGYFPTNATTVDDAYVRQMYSSGQIKLNTDNPPLKDTINIPARGYAVVRFITKNPGVWFFHCHFENHFALGMAMAIRVGSKWHHKAPPRNFPRCGLVDYTDIEEDDIDLGVDYDAVLEDGPRVNTNETLPTYPTLFAMGLTFDEPPTPDDAWLDEENQRYLANVFSFGFQSNTKDEKDNN